MNKNVELDIITLENFVKYGKHKFNTNHKVLCFAVIKRIYRRVKLGYRFGGIKVCEKNLVVDGNHRYIAYSLAGIEFDIIPWTSNRSDEVGIFNSILIDCENDWDVHYYKTRQFCNDNFLIGLDKIK